MIKFYLGYLSKGAGGPLYLLVLLFSFFFGNALTGMFICARARGIVFFRG